MVKYGGKQYISVLFSIPRYYVVAIMCSVFLITMFVTNVLGVLDHQQKFVLGNVQFVLGTV